MSDLGQDAAPFEYLPDPDQRRLLVVCRPIFAMKDALAMIDRKAADGAWGYDGLYDGRAMVWVPTTANIRQLLDRIVRTTKRLGAEPGVSAFVTESPAAFGMGRMLSSLGESAAGFRLEIFKDLPSAERWLAERRAGSGDSAGAPR